MRNADESLIRLDMTNMVLRYDEVGLVDPCDKQSVNGALQFVEGKQFGKFGFTSQNQELAKRRNSIQRGTLVLDTVEKQWDVLKELFEMEEDQYP